ncbi:MAG: hypothetical protein KAS62_10475, partial [Candidatus Delongbacteria bacterium]|nr:hypothetical protein [Candidatus Delongbacteria bacterium]
MFILFFLLAALIEYLFALFVNIFSPKDNTVFILGTMNATLLGSLRVLIMLMPLYFKIKNGRKAFLLILPWFILPIILSSTLINELLISYSDVNKAVFIYTTIIIISIVAMIVFYLKDRKQSSIVDLLVFPIAIIFPISVAMTIEAVNRVIFQYYIYWKIPENFDHGWHVWNMDRYLRFFSVHSMVTLIVGAVLIYVWKKGAVNKIIYNIYLIILLPILFFSLENTVRYVIYNRELLVGKDFIVNHMWSISQYIVFVPMLIVSIYYSKKFLTEGE